MCDAQALGVDGVPVARWANGERELVRQGLPSMSVTAASVEPPRSHQAWRPSSFMRAGPSVMRTNASNATPTARLKAIGLMGLAVRYEERENCEHDHRAAVTTSLERTKPFSTGSARLLRTHSSSCGR